MDEREIGRLRQRLEQLRDELRAVGEIAEAGTRTVELDQTRFGRLFRADALQPQVHGWKEQPHAKEPAATDSATAGSRFLVGWTLPDQ